MTVLRSGPSRGYSDNWAKAFGKPKKSSSASGNKKAATSKKSGKAKTKKSKK